MEARDKTGYPCACRLCAKIKRREYIDGREWVDYLFGHAERALSDGVFEYYESGGVVYLLRNTEPVDMLTLGFEEGTLPEYFDGRRLAPKRVEETRYIRHARDLLPPSLVGQIPD